MGKHVHKNELWQGGKGRVIPDGFVILRATPSAAGPLWLLGIVIWGAWCLLFDISGAHFGTSGAPWGVILASREPWGTILGPRDQPGGPWEQQDGLEVVDNRIFVGLGFC